MDQAELFGRVLKVNQAKPQQKAGEGLGSKTAVWEQVSLLILSFIHSFCFSRGIHVCLGLGKVRLTVSFCRRVMLVDLM